MGGMSTGMRNIDVGKWSLALKAKNHPGVLPVWLSKNISSVQRCLAHTAVTPLCGLTGSVLIIIAVSIESELA